MDDTANKNPQENKALSTLKKYQTIKDGEKDERKIWVKCYQMLNSRVDGKFGQWTAEARSRLIEQGRPTGSFNITKVFVDRICGSQRAMKLDEKCFPRDDEADPVIAEILTDLLRFAKDINQADWAISRMFRDGIITGRGFMKTEWSNDLNQFGEVSIRAINPFRIYIVGTGESYDMTDRRGIIEELPMDKDEIISLYPDHADEIGSLTREVQDENITVPEGYDYGTTGIPVEDIFDKEDKKFKVLRYQRVEYRDIQLLKNMVTGDTKPVDNLKGEDLKTAIGLAQNITRQKHGIVPKRVKYVNVITSIGSVVLEEKPLPYQFRGFDITGFFAYVDNGQIVGKVQDLLDPQDEKNKRKSQALHILGTAAKNSYWVKKGFIDDIDQATTKIGMTGQLIEVNGDPQTGAKAIDSNLSAVPAILSQEERATIDMREISGISEASLGIVPTGVKSGRGIDALQAPTETIVTELLDNLMTTRKIVFKKVLNIMQQYYTRERRVRVLGDYSSQFIPDNMKDQIQKGLVSIQDGMKTIAINVQEGEKTLNDVTVGTYDVYIDEVAQSPSARRAEFNDKLNMKSLGAPVKWSTIFRSYDGRGAKELLADAIEAENFMQAQTGAPPQTAPPDRSATPNKPTAPDQGINLHGGQSPM